VGGYDEVEPLLAAIRESGCSLQDLRLGEADLEDVFIDVMRGRNVGQDRAGLP